MIGLCIIVQVVIRSLVLSLGVIGVIQLNQVLDGISAIWCHRMTGILLSGLLIPYEKIGAYLITWVWPGRTGTVPATEMNVGLQSCSQEMVALKMTERCVATGLQSGLKTYASQIQTWCVFLWIAGILVVEFSKRIPNWVRLEKWKRTLQSPEESLIMQVLMEVKKALTIQEDVIVFHAMAPISPFVFGFFTCHIVIPKRTYQEQELWTIFLHEMTHWKRRDLQEEWILACVQTLYWFNPLVAVAIHLRRQACECACDERALMRTTLVQRQRYCTTILTLLLEQTETGRNSFVRLLSGKKITERRINHIMKQKKYSVKYTGLVAVVVVMILMTAYAGSVYAAETVSTLSVSDAPATLYFEGKYGEDWTPFYETTYYNPSEDDLSMPATEISETYGSEAGISDYLLELGGDANAVIARASKLMWSVSLSDIETSVGSGTKRFQITSAQPWFRIYVLNTSSTGAKLNYTLSYGSANATPFKTGQLTTESGDSAYLGVWHATSYGYYYLNVTSADGSALSGTAAVRRAASQAELNS